MAILSTFSLTADVRTVNLDVSSVPKKSIREESFSVPNLALTDHVVVVKPTVDAGVFVVSARVSAVDELAITFQNVSNQSVDPVAQDYLLLVSPATP